MDLGDRAQTSHIRCGGWVGWPIGNGADSNFVATVQSMVRVIESFGSVVVTMMWSMVALVTHEDHAATLYPIVVIACQCGAISGVAQACQGVWPITCSRRGYAGNVHSNVWIRLPLPLQRCIDCGRGFCDSARDRYALVLQISA